MVAIYPKKQTILIAVICIIAVIGTVVYARNGITEQSNSNIAVTATNTQNPNDQQLVSISSSTNWKNQFLNSTTTSVSLNQTNTNSASDSPQTLTGQLSRELFARFIELKQNNLDSNQQLMQDSADQTLNNTLNNAKQPKTYSSSDISTINTSNLNDQIYHTYGNTVASILITYMPKDNAPAIANDAFENNNMDSLKNIDPLISDYQIIIQKLLNTPTPQPLLNAHLALTNSINTMLFISEGLRNVQGDPMQSILALSMFGNAQDSMKNSLLTIKNYFLNTKITFASNEQGILFSTINP